MVKAEKMYQEKNTTENQSVVYEWTMAESYLHKAREEYADSSFEDAEILANKAMEWMILSEEAEKLSPEEEEVEE